MTRSTQGGGGGGSARGLAAVLGTVLMVSVPAQEREAPPEVDPYTEGSPALLAKAGYESFGPFLFGDGHTSEKVAQALGGVPVLFVETEHFLLGSTLDTYALGKDHVERKRLQEEIKRLRKRIKAVPADPRELDPWLRLHLYAQRLEELYAAFQKALGVSDEAFQPRKGSAERGIGSGPYQGMHHKLSVLLTKKSSSLARYTSLYTSEPAETAFRFHFTEVDGMFVGVCAEALEGSYATDLGMHCAVAFNVIQGLLNGFDGHSHDAPVWWTDGLARWFTRRIDPRMMFGCAPPGEVTPGEEEADWAPKVRARAKNAYYPASSEMLSWSDPYVLSFPDHMIAWSRVDYVLSSLGPETALSLTRAMKVPVGWTVDDRDAVIREQGRQAFVSVLGEPDAFDTAWAAWVEKTYPRK